MSNLAPEPSAPNAGLRAVEVATLGGGCFWCIEAVIQELAGVESVTSGYSGGHVPNVSYEQVCSGRTGHAEVVQVQFDPTVISYHDLLTVFFTVHDPTTRNRQGNDVGEQYRSIVLYQTEEQRQKAHTVIQEIEEAKIWRGHVVTEVVPLREFWPAESYHRDYFRRNPQAAYCRAIIAPKVAKFRAHFVDRLRGPAPVPATRA